MKCSAIRRENVMHILRAVAVVVRRRSLSSAHLNVMNRDRMHRYQARYSYDLNLTANTSYMSRNK